MTARADAVRNREQLVAAGREVFAARGFDATLDEIAAHAGVGTGTAYRHFRNKHELAAEILAEASRQIVTDAERALANPDPWLAVVEFFEATARRQAADRGLYQALAGRGDAGHKAEIWPEIVTTVTALFDRAVAAGAIRADARPEDAAVTLSMLGSTYGLPGDAGREPWRRYLRLLLDGLRATDRPALGEPPPTMASFDDMLAVKHEPRPARRR